MSDETIEQEIQAKGLTAPRVTPADIEANIANVEIVKHVSESGQILRWAVITTRNGFAVVGKPSCAVSAENDNAEIGEKVAIENSREELWPLMGYALKERLYRESLGDVNQYADEQNAARLQMTVELVNVLGLPNSATCDDVVDAVLTRHPMSIGSGECLSFGQALDALKRGLRVARAGWNGKGMWLSLSCDGTREVAAENFWSPHNAEFARENGGTARVQPCITMKNAQDDIQMGWAATQSDMLADDWMIV